MIECESLVYLRVIDLLLKAEGMYASSTIRRRALSSGY